MVTNAKGMSTCLDLSQEISMMMAIAFRLQMGRSKQVNSVLGKNSTESSFVDSFTNKGMGTSCAFKDEDSTWKDVEDNIRRASTSITSQDCYMVRAYNLEVTAQHESDAYRLELMNEYASLISHSAPSSCVFLHCRFL